MITNYLCLTAGINILNTLKVPKYCGTPALVTAYQGPCPDDKYTDGFNQQSLTGQYTYDNSGSLTYDPHKKLTFHYNHHNLPYRIVGAENDELQMLYGADGTLLQKKYLKNNVTISKTDYLRGAEYKNGALEAVYHDAGRVVKTGATTYSYEYFIKDHLDNVRTTFADDNGDGLIIGAERRSRNDYYSFGMEWNGAWNASETYSPSNTYKFGGKEEFTEMSVNMLNFENRFLDPILGRFSTLDKLSDHPDQVDKSPYSAFWNNPIKYDDPDGNCPNCLFGAFISAAIDLSLQVAKNKLQGNDAFHNIDKTSVAVSFASGFASGGISTLSKVSAIGKLALETGVNTTESLVNQARIGDGEITVIKTVSDVGAGFVGSKVGIEGINTKSLADNADRLTRTALKSDKSIDVKKAVAAEKSLSRANNFNIGVNYSVQNSTEGVIQNTVDGLRSLGGKTVPTVKSGSTYSFMVTDNNQRL